MIRSAPIVFPQAQNFIIPPWQTLAVVPIAYDSIPPTCASIGNSAMVYDGTDRRFVFDDSLVRDDGGFVTPPEMSGFQRACRRIRRGLREFLQVIRDGIAEGGVAVGGDSHTCAQALPPKGSFRGAYILDRDLQRSSVFTQVSLGLPLQSWIIQEVEAACRARQDKFQILVLGTGDGNAEVELVKGLAAAKAERNLHIDINIIALALPGEGVTEANLSVMRTYSDRGISFNGFTADFDEGLPWDNIDVAYGIASTIYSRDPLNLTIRIHDALRKPTAGRPGGQAFFKYWSALADPAFEMERHFFDLRRFGFDIAVSVPLANDFDEHAFVHMTRISARPARRLGEALVAVEPMPRCAEFRTLADSSSVIGANKASDIFIFGAKLLFAGNGLSPDALPDDMHREIFASRIWSAVLGGMPIYPDSVLVAYGMNLGAIDKHGKDFEQYLPSHFIYKPSYYIPTNWSRRYRPLI